MPPALAVPRILVCGSALVREAKQLLPVCAGDSGVADAQQMW